MQTTTESINSTYGQFIKVEGKRTIYRRKESEGNARVRGKEDVRKSVADRKGTFQCNIRSSLRKRLLEMQYVQHRGRALDRRSRRATTLQQHLLNRNMIRDIAFSQLLLQLVI